MKLYVSGPMSGIENNNFGAFNAAARKLRDLGHIVVNPAEFDLDPEYCWSDYLRQDIKAMLDCDGIYLLRGWEKSQGSNLEQHIAHRLDMLIVFEEISLNTLGGNHE